MQILKLILVPIVASTLLTGCINIDRGSKFNADNIPKLQVGVTTEAEILEMIGKPMSRQRNSDGTVMLMYNFASAKINPWDITHLSNRTRHSTLVIHTDANGKYLKHSQTEGNH